MVLIIYGFCGNNFMSFGHMETSLNQLKTKPTNHLVSAETYILFVDAYSYSPCPCH